MTGRGRPLRFLALVLSGWIAMRAAMLWPRGGDETRPAVLPALPAPARPRVAAVPADTSPAVSPPPRAAHPRAIFATRAIAPALAPATPVATAAPPVAASRPDAQPEPPPSRVAVLVAPSPSPPATVHDRWQASAWLAARPGDGIATGQPQLGGSQAGARLAWIADPGRRIALVGRLAAPLRGQGREATLALEWQPTRLPLRIVVERRFALDRSTGGPGIGVVGGIAALPVAAGFRLEAYAQAGMLRRARSEPYADGAARIAAPLLRGHGGSVSLGLGAWGGAQRDAQRADIGPTLVAALPLGGRSYRVALDWRQRIVGAARPGSGPALTLGADF